MMHAWSTYSHFHLSFRYAGDVNIFIWTNAYYPANYTAQFNYTIADPFAFNCSMTAPVGCLGDCPIYQAEYGPFTGTNGSVRLELSAEAEQGQYNLQCSFYQAPRNNAITVVFGHSQNFAVAPRLQGDPIKPYYEYDSSTRSAKFTIWSTISAVIFAAALGCLL
jgi:hypothetical protein